MGIIVSWIVYAIAIYLTAYLLPGIKIVDFPTALLASVGLGLINAIIRPIILLLTLPLNILTLGLLTFVINALMVMLAAELVPGFAVESFWWAVLFSLVLSVVNALLGALVGKK